MRDINDPENPYREQYEEWDYYCFANARRKSSEDSKAWNRKKVPLTRRSLLVEIDALGFPVPIMLSNQQRMEWYRDPQPIADENCKLTYEVYADVPEGLDERMYAAEQELRAQFVPRIPGWLAQNPPLQALMLTDGSVVAFGDLGSGYNCTVYTDFHRRIDWDEVAVAHYSPEGELLAQLDPGGPWCALFWPEADAVLSGFDVDKTCWWQENGFVIVQQIEGWKPLAIYSYDGTPMPLDTDPLSQDNNIWAGWFGREIVLMYAAQQHDN